RGNETVGTGWKRRAGSTAVHVVRVVVERAGDEIADQIHPDQDLIVRRRLELVLFENVVQSLEEVQKSQFRVVLERWNGGRLKCGALQDGVTYRHNNECGQEL